MTQFTYSEWINEKYFILLTAMFEIAHGITPEEITVAEYAKQKAAEARLLPMEKSA